jgi:DNA gyrase subunit A
VQGPTSPPAASSSASSGIANAYRTGRGRFMMRAKAAIEHHRRKSQAIIVTEIPYQVNKSKLIERIAELVNEKIIDDIADVPRRERPRRHAHRHRAQARRAAEIVLNQLYKHTQMQESFSMIFLAVVKRPAAELPARPGHPRLHRSPHRSRPPPHRLPARKAREREHILLGYQIALDHLDTVIKIIRGVGLRAEARENLFSYFSGASTSGHRARRRQPRPRSTAST